MAKKGQASLEQLFVTALGIGFIAVILVIALNFGRDEIRVAQGRDTVEKLAKSADYVYALGPGAKDRVTVFIPEGTRFVNITNNTVHLRVSLSSGDADIFAHTSAPLLGYVPASSGRFETTVMATWNGGVLFGDSSLACSPSFVSASLVQGSSGNSSLNVTNVGESLLTGISANLSGSIATLATITQPKTNLSVGEDSTVNITFGVPPGQAVGAYGGSVSVNDSNNSYCDVSVTLFVFTPVDDKGPVVTAIAISPQNPRKNESITVTAFCDDTLYGNSTIASAELELDGAGGWNAMSPTDGQWNSSVKNVTYALGTAAQGDHTVKVRCTDSLGNLGNATAYNFSVKGGKNILIITLGATPTAGEQRWINWLAGHSSAAGFAWDYDVAQVSDVTGGAVNVSNYGIVALTGAPAVGNALYTTLNTYRTEGHYVVLLGIAMSNGLRGLGVSGVNSVSESRDQLRPGVAHYVTTGYVVGTLYTVTSGNRAWYYNNNFVGTNILASESNTGRAVALEATKVITYGLTQPDFHTANGDTFATRVFDYALTNSPA